VRYTNFIRLIICRVPSHSEQRISETNLTIDTRENVPDDSMVKPSRGRGGSVIGPYLTIDAFTIRKS
jgi:hypothetical protein